jgi:tetratricopeptide (TPR) repeat protein
MYCIYNGDCDRGIANLQTALRLNPKDSAAKFKAEQNEPISAASLQHGQRQVRQMLHDRPVMASLGDKAAPLTRWAARKFAGEDLHQEILWDPSAPPPGASAQHELPMPGQPGRILIAQRYREGSQTGRELSFEEMWHGAVYEFYNITNRERFFRIVSDAAHGRLSRTEYATQVVAAESRAAELTRAFYIHVFLPWARQNGVATHPGLWYLARSDRTEDLLLPYVDKKGDYWQNYLRQYDTIAPQWMIEKEKCEAAIAQASEAERKATRPKQKASARLARGAAFAKMRQYDKAIADFDKVIQSNADSVEAYEARADAYTQKCLYDKAIADYNEAIRRAAKNSQLRLRRGTIFAWQGKFDAALADVNAAVTLDPKNQEARDSRDWIKKRAAEKMAAALTPQRPDTGSSVDHNKIEYQPFGNGNKVK